MEEPLIDWFESNTGSEYPQLWLNQDYYLLYAFVMVIGL